MVFTVDLEMVPSRGSIIFPLALSMGKPVYSVPGNPWNMPINPAPCYLERFSGLSRPARQRPTCFGREIRWCSGSIQSSGWAYLLFLPDGLALGLAQLAA
jgi:hypothetical protein